MDFFKRAVQKIDQVIQDEKDDSSDKKEERTSSPSRLKNASNEQLIAYVQKQKHSLKRYREQIEALESEKMELVNQIDDLGSVRDLKEALGEEMSVVKEKKVLYVEKLKSFDEMMDKKIEEIGGEENDVVVLLREKFLNSQVMCEEYKEETETVKRNLKSLEDEMAIKVEREEKLSAKIQKLKGDISNSADELSQSKTEIEERNKEILSLKNDIDQQKESLESFESILNLRVIEIEQKNSQIAILENAENKELENELRSEISFKENEIQSLEIDVQERDTVIEGFKEEILQKSNTIQDLTDKIDHCDARLFEVTTIYQTLENNNIDQNSHIKLLEKTVLEKDESIENLHSDISKLNETVESLEKYVEDKNIELDNLKEIVSLNQIATIDTPADPENENKIILLEEKITSLEGVIGEKESMITELQGIRSNDSRRNSPDPDTHNKLNKEIENLKEELALIKNEKESLAVRMNDQLENFNEKELYFQNEIIELEDQLDKNRHNFVNDEITETFQIQISTLMEVEELLRKTLSEKENIITDLEDQIVTIRNQVPDSDSNVPEANEKILKLENEIKDLNSLLQTSNEKNDELNIELNEKDQVVVSLKQQLDTERANMKNILDEKTQLIEERDIFLSNLKSENESNLVLLAERENELTEIETQLSSYKIALEERNSWLDSNAVDREKIASVTEKLNELEQQIILKDQLIEKSDSKQRDLQEEISQLRDEKDIKDQLISELEMKVRTTTEQLETLQTEVNDLRESALDTTALEETLKESDSQKQNISQLQEQNNQLKSKLAGLKTLLQRAKAHIEENKQTLLNTENELASEKAKSLKASQSLGKLQLNQEEQIELRVQDLLVQETEKMLKQISTSQSQKDSSYENQLTEMKISIEKIQDEYESYKRKAQALLSQQPVISDPVSEDNTQVVELMKSRISKLKESIIEKDDAIKQLQSYKTETSSLISSFQQKEKEYKNVDSMIQELHIQLEQNDAHNATLTEKLQELQVEHKLLLKSSTQQKSKLQKEVLDLKETKKSLNEEISTYNLKISELEENIQSSRSGESQMNEELNERIQDLEILVKSLETENSQKTEELTNNEDPFYTFATLQAQKEKELKKTKDLMKYLENELHEATKMNDLHLEQERVLKEVIRSLQTEEREDMIDIYYLKTTIIQLLQSPSDFDKLLPIISNILHFSEEELQRTRISLSNSQKSYWSSFF